MAVQIPDGICFDYKGQGNDGYFNQRNPQGFQPSFLIPNS